MKNYLLKVLIFLLHIVCLVFIETFCISRLIWSYDWSWDVDLFMVLISAVMLGLHYLLITRKPVQKVLDANTIRNLTVIELLLFGILVYLCYVPNQIFDVTDRGWCLLGIILQIAVVLSRLIYWLFWLKRKRLLS